MAINKVILLGNVGKEVEVRNLDNGSKVATFSLATSEKGYTTQSGQTVPERTTWHNIVAWKQLADVLEKYVQKGDKIYIEGKITNRSYENAQKQTVWITEIVAEKIELLGGRREQQSYPAQNQHQQNPQQNDDLPF